MFANMFAFNLPLSIRNFSCSYGKVDAFLKSGSKTCKDYRASTKTVLDCI